MTAQSRERPPAAFGAIGAGALSTALAAGGRSTVRPEDRLAGVGNRLAGVLLQPKRWSTPASRSHVVFRQVAAGTRALLRPV
jgi:hypothetical protein